MKSYSKYIGPLILCGLIITLFTNIRFDRRLTLNLRGGNKIQPLAKVRTGAVKYLFYKHMFVDVITH